MNLFDYIIPFILALGALVFFHELGHYLVARWCGVKVLRFSIGFGRPLVKWTAGKDRTEWALAAVPLGGYVKMLDEREAPVPQALLHRAFNRQTVWRRFAIVAAGPLANFLLAIVLYWGLFVTGIEELRPRITLADTVAGQTQPSPAALAGVQEGDLVIAAGDTAIRSWADLRWTLLREALDQKTVVLRVRTERGDEAFRTLDFKGIKIDDGDSDLIARIGLRPWQPSIPPIIGDIAGGSAAERAGLMSGDTVLSLAGRPVQSWTDFVRIVREHPGQTIDARLERQGTTLQVALTPDSVAEGGTNIGRVGVAVAEQAGQRDAVFTVVSYGVGEGLEKAAVKTWDTSALTLKMIGRMFTGDVSWKNLTGPVTIANYAGQTAKLGLVHYLGFVALISISLGVLNLLPIPVLDGGHLLYYTIEIIKGSPVSERAMEIGQQIGLAALAMLMAFAFYNDINRLISG